MGPGIITVDDLDAIAKTEGELAARHQEAVIPISVPFQAKTVDPKVIKALGVTCLGPGTVMVRLNGKGKFTEMKEGTEFPGIIFALEYDNEDSQSRDSTLALWRTASVHRPVGSTVAAPGATDAGATVGIFGWNGASWVKVLADAVKGLFATLKQDGAELSAANPLPTKISQGGLDTGATNPLVVQGPAAIDGEVQIYGPTAPGAGTPTAEIATGIAGKQGAVKIKSSSADAGVTVAFMGTSGGTPAMRTTLVFGAAGTQDIKLQGWERFMVLTPTGVVTLTAFSELFK